MSAVDGLALSTLHALLALPGPPPEEARAPEVEWEETPTIAGSGYCVEPTADGAFLVAGAVDPRDACLRKVDARGGTLWLTQLGGAGAQAFLSVVETGDGAFAAAGWTESPAARGVDVYLVKVSAAGKVLWEKTHGGAQLDEAHAVVKTRDGGFAIAGKTTSFGKGDANLLLLKADAAGDLRWQATFGGPGHDEGWAVEEASDGGILAAGTADTWGEEGSQALLVKTDARGKLVWQREFGGPQDDRFYAVKEAEDGACVAAGYSKSVNAFGGGANDAFVVKVSAAGDRVWERTLGNGHGSGGTGHFYAFALERLRGVGFVVAGETTCLGSGKDAVYVAALGADGGFLWDKVHGGGEDRRGRSVCEAPDGGLVVAGEGGIEGDARPHPFLLKLKSEGAR